MTTGVDETAALRAFLLAQATIVGLVGTRVFVFELPAREAPLMPRAAIVINDAGFASMGQQSGSRVPFANRTKDLKCYGATSLEARAVWNACEYALTRMRPHVRNDVKLYSAVMGGPQLLREPEVDWPLCYSTFNLAAATIAAG